MKIAECPYCYSPLRQTKYRHYTEIFCRCGWSCQLSGKITQSVLTRQAKSCQADRGPESKPLYLD